MVLPLSLRFHLPRLQQLQMLCHKSAQHSKAALGLLCCPHHRLERPMSWGAPHGGGDSTALIFECCAPPPLLDMVLRIFSTPFSRSWTAVLSPPRSGLPHATTVPSAKTAAKASCVLQICCTFLS